MSDQQIVNVSTNAAEESESSVNIRDVLYLCLYKWPWVLASVVVCVAMAVLYLLYTPPTYTRSASLLVKDDSKGKSISSDVDFGNLGLFQSNINVNNEVSSLKSPDMMEEVVRRLRLNVNYYAPGRFHKLVVYGDSLPVRVKFIDNPETGSCSFNLKVDAKGMSTMSKFKIDDEELADDKTVTGYFGDTVVSPCGKVLLIPGPAYQLGGTAELQVVKSGLMSTVDAYSKALAVALDNDKGSVINLTFKNSSIERADDVLSALISVYNENWIADKNQIAVSTSNFIDERLKVIESELGNVDQDISSYKSTHLIPDVQQSSALYMQQNTANEAEILSLNNQMQMSRYIRDYLTQIGDDNSRVLPANAGIDNAGIKEQLDNYNNRVLQRNSLVSNSSESNPLVVDINAQLASLRGAILSSVDNNIVALSTQIQNLKGNERKITSRIAANPTQAKYLLSVERQQKVKESLYLFLLQKREENELSQAFTAYNTRIIVQPGGSWLPTAPKKMNILMVAFVLGLMIPFGVIYMREAMNTRIRGRKDLEKVLMPFLGEIPMVKDAKGKKEDKEEDKKIVVQHGKRDVVNEAFRVVRTNLSFIASKAEDQKCTVFMVTSFNPGSGKSFLSVNLAASLAIQGEKVLVIDGDLRHGSTSAYVNSPSKGLSDYLIGATNDINPLIVTENLPKNMSILPIGTIPPNPAELLQSPRLNALVERFKDEYSYVFIDCPPIEMLADAQIIEKLVDRTIFVVRAGLLQRSMVPELDKLYNEKKFKNMCLILNATAADGTRYGYNYGYGYGYGYKYGYGHYASYGEEKKK